MQRSVEVSSAAAQSSVSAFKGTRFELDTSACVAEFLMDAPLEQIHGELRQAAQGAVYLEGADLRSLRGEIRMDLDRLVLAQQKREHVGETFGARVVHPGQNAHMKNWLEIGSDVPPAARERHRWATFTITGIDNVKVTRSDAATGAPLNATLDLIGNLELHARQSSQRVTAELTIERSQAASIQRLVGKTTTPLRVSLDTHDVRPREAFGKLAKATLESLGQKVASEVPVDLTLVAASKAPR